MNDTIKVRLIKHYCSREPTQFVQFDGFLGKPNDKSDSVVQFDEEGHSLLSGVTWELMHGADVRVFVKPSTPPKHAAKLLRKIRKWIKRGGMTHSASTEARQGEDAQDMPDIPF